MPTTKDHFTYTVHEWNQGLFSSFLDMLPKDLKCLWDVGANVGGFAHVIRQRYPEISVVCFEPVKDNFMELALNANWATLFPYGIYYGARESRAMWRGSNDGAVFLEQIDSGEPRVERGNEILLLYELEDVIAPAPDLLKLDVEGAEKNIIENSTMIRDIPWIIVEWHENSEAERFFSKNLPRHTIVSKAANQYLLAL